MSPQGGERGWLWTLSRMCQRPRERGGRETEISSEQRAALAWPEPGFKRALVAEESRQEAEEARSPRRKGHLEAAKRLSLRADALAQGTRETGTRQEEGGGTKGWTVSSILYISFWLRNSHVKSKWRLVSFNLGSANKGDAEDQRRRDLPKVLQQIKSGNMSRTSGSFSVPCCASVPQSPSASSQPAQAHLIPSSSLAELRLSGTTQGPTLHHTPGWASLITGHRGGQAS